MPTIRNTSRPLPERARARAALAELAALGTTRDRENLARFGITASKAYGVSMANVQRLAKRLGRSHELAAALWKSGWYEARLLTAFVDEPALVTPAQMDRWCRDFDNWAICDTLCFHLFDRTPHAWAMVARWHRRREEFERRAAFALLASLALHDKSAGDERFVPGLAMIERSAGDDRNFVKKGVSWALRLIGRRNAALHRKAIAVARWIGKGAVRELTSPAVTRRLLGGRRGSRRDAP